MTPMRLLTRIRDNGIGATLSAMRPHVHRFSDGGRSIFGPSIPTERCDESENTYLFIINDNTNPPPGKRVEWFTTT